MKLYHGTTAAVARAALTEGLLPRSESGVESRWEACPSNDELVYLTTAYAGYFACHAAEPQEPWGIVEINSNLLRTRNLVPDEDWLEQSCRMAPDLPPEYAALDMPARTKFWRSRQRDLSSLWRDSIKGLGNCAHVGPIPARAVTRVSIFDPKSNPGIALTVVDPVISVLNYGFCQGKYHALIRWFMDEDVTVEEFHGYAAVLVGQLLSPKQREACEKMLATRDGLEIIER